MFDTAQVWHQCAFENTNKRLFFVVNDRLAQLERGWKAVPELVSSLGLTNKCRSVLWNFRKRQHCKLTAAPI